MMSMNKFAAVVRRAVDSLPGEIKRHLENVVIDVEEEPSVEFLLEAGFTEEEIEAGDTLYGYFMPLPWETVFAGNRGRFRDRNFDPPGQTEDGSGLPH